jgi:hypothetical protein
VFGIEPDQHGREYSHQKPSKMALDAQLQLKVFPHTHGPIVRAPALSRLLSHPGDMSAFPNVSGPIELRVALQRLVDAYAAALA